MKEVFECFWAPNYLGVLDGKLGIQIMIEFLRFKLQQTPSIAFDSKNGVLNYIDWVEANLDNAVPHFLKVEDTSYGPNPGDELHVIRYKLNDPNIIDRALLIRKFLKK